MLYLIGFMGVGKTTIGNQLAKQHGITFFVIDKEIEKKRKKKIADIFQKDGEDNFRKLETKILTTIQGKKIVSCGGGLPIYNNNMRFIKKSGASIYLRASEDELFLRLSKDLKKRPLIENKTNENLRNFIKETLAKREKFYTMADYTIETSTLSKKDVLQKINALFFPL